jgi:hypothetical protein
LWRAWGVRAEVVVEVLEKSGDDEVRGLRPCKLRVMEEVLPCGMINETTQAHHVQLLGRG